MALVGCLVSALCSVQEKDSGTGRAWCWVLTGLGLEMPSVCCNYYYGAWGGGGCWDVSYGSWPWMVAAYVGHRSAVAWWRRWGAFTGRSLVRSLLGDGASLEVSVSSARPALSLPAAGPPWACHHNTLHCEPLDHHYNAHRPLHCSCWMFPQGWSA